MGHWDELAPFRPFPNGPTQQSLKSPTEERQQIYLCPVYLGTSRNSESVFKTTLYDLSAMSRGHHDRAGSPMVRISAFQGTRVPRDEHDSRWPGFDSRSAQVRPVHLNFFASSPFSREPWFTPASCSQRRNDLTLVLVMYLIAQPSMIDMSISGRHKELSTSTGIQ